MVFHYFKILRTLDCDLADLALTLGIGIGRSAGRQDEEEVGGVSEAQRSLLIQEVGGSGFGLGGQGATPSQPTRPICNL